MIHDKNEMKTASCNASCYVASKNGDKKIEDQARKW